MWKVGKKQHFATGKQLTAQDIDTLRGIAPSNFHYLSESNILFIRQHFKVDKVKNVSILIDIQDLSFKGKQYSSIRHCLNRCKDQFILETNICGKYKNIFKQITRKITTFHPAPSHS